MREKTPGGVKRHKRVKDSEVADIPTRAEFVASGVRMFGEGARARLERDYDTMTGAAGAAAEHATDPVAGRG